MRRHDPSYLANEFHIKNRSYLSYHFQELPDAIVKCYSDKFVGKINPILWKITTVLIYGTKNAGSLHRSVPSKSFFWSTMP